MDAYEWGRFSVQLAFGAIVTVVALVGVREILRTQARTLSNGRPDPANRARACAMASWLLTLAAAAETALLGANRGFVTSFFVGGLVLAAIAAGIYALTNIRRFGRAGLLMPAVVGLSLNGFLVLCAVWGFLRR